MVQKAVGRFMVKMHAQSIQGQGVAKLVYTAKLGVIEYLTQQLLPGLLFFFSRCNRPGRHLFQQPFCSGKCDGWPGNPRRYSRRSTAIAYGYPEVLSKEACVFLVELRLFR
jgi:hypothetical protein